MSVLPILRWPDDRLAASCAPVDCVDADVQALASDMLETMYDAKGRGLAAPQIGVLRRVFVMDAGWKEGAPTPITMVNPVAVSASSERVTGPEGCLSVPGITAQVARSPELRLRWTDLDGATQESDLTGFEAICAQHEMDHLDGVMHFDRIASVQRQRLLARYGAPV